MSYIKAFTEKLAELNSNLDNYFNKLEEYKEKIPHQLLAGIIEPIERAFDFAQKNSMGLVDHLKVREAFDNHGLGEEKIPTKLLHAAILKNPVQFETAFDRHRAISRDKIFEQTQNIAYATSVTYLALDYAETLLVADWRPGDEVPTDEKPKWVWLTDGFFTYLAKEARYDLKEGKWNIKHETTKPYFTIHNWTDISKG
jgi:hypothetical protein